MQKTDALDPKYTDEDIERLLITGGGPRLIANRLKEVEAALRSRHRVAPACSGAAA